MRDEEERTFKKYETSQRLSMILRDIVDLDHLDRIEKMTIEYVNSRMDNENSVTINIWDHHGHLNGWVTSMDHLDKTAKYTIRDEIEEVLL